jgi:Major intrinsic protein
MAIYSAADVCINPVRAFGPAFISNQFGGHWVAWLGPILGAVSGALCFQFIFREKPPSEEEEDLAADNAAERANSGGNAVVDIESRPEKIPLQHTLDSDKPRMAAVVGRRSRVRPMAAAANGDVTAAFNYSPAMDPDNLSLDGTKESRGYRQRNKNVLI